MQTPRKSKLRTSSKRLWSSLVTGVSIRDLKTAKHFCVALSFSLLVLINFLLVLERYTLMFIQCAWRVCFGHKSANSEKSVMTYLPPAYVLRREVIFSLCSPFVGGGGGTPSQVQVGGTPSSWQGGTPFPGWRTLPRSRQGVPHPADRGYPIQLMGGTLSSWWGVPYPADGEVSPSQVGGTPSSWQGGYSIQMTGGVPHLANGGYPIQLIGGGNPFPGGGTPFPGPGGGTPSSQQGVPYPADGRRYLNQLIGDTPFPGGGTPPTRAA